MKRLILGLAAAAAVAGPLAAAAPASAQGWRDHDRGSHDGRGDRGDRGDRSDRGRWDGGRWDGDRRDGGRWDGDRGRGWDRDRDHDRGGEWRGARWDGNHHNGYWYNNRWFYGPPRAEYYGAPGFRLGYSAWRRGGYLPPYYRNYVVTDYYNYRLRRPPYGYHWVRVGPDYLLVAATTGLIFDIIANAR